MAKFYNPRDYHTVGFSGNKNCDAQVYEYCLRNSVRPCWPRIGPNGETETRHCWGPEYSFPQPGWRRDRHCAAASQCTPVGEFEPGWEHRAHNKRAMQFQRKMGVSARQIAFAEKTLAKSISHDVQRHFLDQEQNARSVAANYTA